MRRIFFINRLLRLGCFFIAFAHWGYGAVDGDALFLQGFRVSGSGPDVSNGQIAPSGGGEDWKDASARVVKLYNSGDVDSTEFTILIANNDDSLYIAAVGYLPNASASNTVRFYFDQNNDGILSGSASSPGEYYVEIVGEGGAADGGWNGASWSLNSAKAPGLEGKGVRKGSGGSRLFNWEFRIPLRPAASSGNAYLNVNAGDNLGFFIEILMNSGNSYYWVPTNRDKTYPAGSPGWGNLYIPTSQVAARDVASLRAKGILPTIDGNISGDDNWRFAFQKAITLTDFNGNKLANSKLLMKESATGNLLMGVKVNIDPDNNNDYLQAFFDQGTGGGSRNYILNGGTTKDDAVRITGGGSYTDMKFGDSDSWSGDISADGVNDTAAAYKNTGVAWEFEILKPFNSSSSLDLNVVTTDKIGLLLKFHDADNDRNYWWSATINDDVLKVDPVDGDYSALGWAVIHTGGPFVQPVYPRQDETMSGTAILMVYAEDEDGVANVTGMEYRVTDLNDNVLIDFSSATEMTKINNAISGLWTGTFNSNSGTTPDGNYNIIFRVTDDESIVVNVPVQVTIQNQGEGVGPTISNLNLKTGDVVSGQFTLRFDLLPSSGNLMAPDSIQLSLDGGTWAKADSTPAITGGTGADTLKSSPLGDGVHSIQIRAKDSGDETWGYSNQVLFNVKNTTNIPGVTITGPADSAVKSGNVNVTFSVTPPINASIDSSQISVGGVNWTKTSGGTSHTLDSRLLDDGAYLLFVRSFGSNGTVGYSRPISLLVNNGMLVSIDSPISGSAVSGNVTVTFASTSTGGISHTDLFLVDGKQADTCDTDTSHTWNTQTLKDGTHTLQIKSADTKGRVGYSPLITVMVQNGPTVATTGPAADSALSGTFVVPFTASAVSPATITGTQISVDGGPWRNTSTGSTDTLDSRALTEGAHTLQIKVTDSDGRTGLSRILKVSVRNAPGISLTVPEAGKSYSGDLSVQFTATPVSPATLAKTEISIDGKPFGNTTNNTTHALNTIFLADGEHTMVIRATDSEGKYALSVSRMFVVNNTPVVAIDSPKAGQVVSGEMIIKFTVTKASEADSITSVAYSIGGGNWQNIENNGRYVLDTRNYSDGGHNLQIKALNKNGKIGMSKMLKFKLKNNPGIRILNPPSDSILIGEKSIRFKPEPVSPDSIVKVEISIGGGGWKDVWKDGDDESDSSYTLNGKDYKDGNLRVQFRATDASGKTGLSRIREFIIDNSAPKLTLPRLRYADNNFSSLTSTSILATVMAFDITSGMAGDSAVSFIYTKPDTSIDTTKTPADTTVDTVDVEVILYDDGPAGGHNDNVAGDNIYTNLVSVKLAITGPRAFQLKAVDAVGNIKTIDSVLILDNTPPEVGYNVTPKLKSGSDSIHGEVYDDKILLKGKAFDLGSGLKTVRINVRNTENEHINNSPINITAERGNFSRIINLIEGKNIITLVGQDNAGYIDSIQGIITYIRPKVSKIVKSSGGKVASPNGSSVDIPRDALFRAKEITMRVVDEKEEPKPLDENIHLLGNPHEFGPDGTIFRKPVRVTLAYTDLDLDPDQDLTADIKPEDLAIYFWDGSSWLKAGNPILDKEKKTISVEVNHFTMFDIGLDTASASVPTEFEAYWTHNPVKEDEGSTMVVQIPKRGNLSISIFDMAGDLVRKLVDKRGVEPGQVSEMWTGSNTMGHFAGAGLYIYLLKYNSDDKSIKRLIRKPVGLLKK